MIKNEPKGKRLQSLKRENKIHDVHEARKKKEMKQKAQARKSPIFEIRAVYVGNLISTITRERLEDVFIQCGSIIDTKIRCSRGKAVTMGVAVPLDALSPRDRQYATVEFRDTKAARKALGLNGIVVDGCSLVVSASPADLPEVQDMTKPVLDKLLARNKHNRPRPASRIPPPAKPVAPCDTERFIDFHDPASDRFCIFGVPFGKCVT